MYLISEYGDIIRDYCGDYRILIIQQNNCKSTKVNRYSFAGKLAEEATLLLTHIEIGKVVHSQILSELMIALYQATISLKHGNGVNNPVVCCCFAQYKMGNGLGPYYMDSLKTDSTYKKNTRQF